MEGQRKNNAPPFLSAFSGHLEMSFECGHSSSNVLIRQNTDQCTFEELKREDDDHSIVGATEFDISFCVDVKGFPECFSMV